MTVVSLLLLSNSDVLDNLYIYIHNYFNYFLNSVIGVIYIFIIMIF